MVEEYYKKNISYRCQLVLLAYSHFKGKIYVNRKSIPYFKGFLSLSSSNIWVFDEQISRHRIVPDLKIFSEQVAFEDFEVED